MRVGLLAPSQRPGGGGRQRDHGVIAAVTNAEAVDGLT